MQKVTRLSVLLVVVGAVLAAVAAGVYIARQAPSSSALDEFLTYVPADSPLVFAKQTRPEHLAASDAMLRNANPADLQPILEGLEASEENSAAQLVRWLLNDYLHTGMVGGYQGIHKRYGVDLTRPYGLYVHGAAPVIRFALTGPEPLEAVLAQAAEATGVEARQSTLGGATLYAWPLDEGRPGLELGLVLGEQSLTLSLLTGSDTLEQQSRRFARQPVQASLAGSERLGELRADYAQADQFMGYLDFHRLVEAFLLPEQNSTGRELRQWVPELDQRLSQGISDACRRDYVALASQMPRITLGAQVYDVRNGRLHQQVDSTWSIEHAGILTSLQKLQGFVPAYARQADDKLAAFALGLDAGQLVPVLTELWSRFTRTRFECEPLQQLQQQAGAYNPVVLAVGTALFDSVRGVGAALFDLKASERTPVGLDGSVLFSLSSENPGALAGMATAYLPGALGLKIPDDGTPIEVPDPLGLGGVYAAIKGKHLVIYRGDAAKTAAQALAGEGLEAKGLMAAVLNLSEPKALFDRVEPAMARTGSAGCSALYTGLLSLTRNPMTLTAQNRLTDRGWESSLGAVVEIVEPLEASTLEGHYQIAQLSDTDCQWQPAGMETLKAGGIGQFAGDSPGGDCHHYRAEFSWKLAGRLLTQVSTAERYRDTCDSDWEAVEGLERLECGILSYDDTGFYCTAHTDGVVGLYRYDRR